MANPPFSENIDCAGGNSSEFWVKKNQGTVIATMDEHPDSTKNENDWRAQLNSAPPENRGFMIRNSA